MTDRHALQGPADFSDWTPAGDDEEGGRVLDAERLMKMAQEPDEEFSPDSDEALKQALRDQHYADHFLVEDPSDTMTNKELWEAMPKPWLPNGEEA